ncbi:hypothetical protein WG66_009201, partial [Moniliophthora roreri]
AVVIAVDGEERRKRPRDGPDSHQITSLKSQRHRHAAFDRRHLLLFYQDTMLYPGHILAFLCIGNAFQCRITD